MNRHGKFIYGTHFLIIILVFLTSTSYAVELKGKVLKTIQKQVEIELVGDLLPQIGDPVVIGFILPSVGFVALQGKWSISAVGATTITASPEGETKQPQKDQLVSIQSPVPQERRTVAQAADSINQLADDYYYGRNGQEKNYTKALELFHQAASQGSLDAMVSIGYMHANSKGVAKNETEAAKWFHKAAELGLAAAQSNLGFMYRFGKGVTQDYEKAVLWSRKGAEQGHAMGQETLGVMYFHGQGIAQDQVEAARWFRKAASQGDADAQKNLGIMYESGFGVTQDSTEAVRWYRKAAKNGSSFAQKALIRLGQ